MIQPSSHTSPIPGKATHAVVLVHYGEPEATRRCVLSLAQREPFSHEVIVVDHGPGEGLAEALEGTHPALTILRAHDNPGFGAGCNRGASDAFRRGAEGVWFLNNDAVIEGPRLQELVDLAGSHPDVAFWAHIQLDRGQVIGADQQPAWYVTAVPEPPVAAPGCRYLSPRESLSGASLFMSRPQWELVGPWPEDYFLYYEDAAYCHRVHRLGRFLALLDRSILHDRGTTTGRRSPLTVFYGIRNRLLLHRDLHPEGHLARFWMSLDLLQKRFFQFRWGLLKPTWNGIWAAARSSRGRDPRY